MKPISREKRGPIVAAGKAGGFAIKAGALGSIPRQQSTFLSSGVLRGIQSTSVSDRCGEFDA